MDTRLTHIFTNLIGSWDFTRTIIDYGANTQMSANGRVEFTPLNNYKLAYREKGTLLINDKQLSFTRKYDYCLLEQQIKIYFADGVNYGALFQTLEVNFETTPATAKASHLCINDTYQGTFSFYDNQHFKNSFRINGPHKDQLIDTVFVKRGQIAKADRRQRTDG